LALQVYYAQNGWTVWFSSLDPLHTRRQTTAQCFEVFLFLAAGFLAEPFLVEAFFLGEGLADFLLFDAAFFLVGVLLGLGLAALRFGD